MLPKNISINEVGARDGLQNEKINISDWRYLNLINLKLVSPIKLNLETIKKFCMLPPETYGIEIRFFPWEVVKNTKIVIDYDNPYDANLD